MYNFIDNHVFTRGIIFIPQGRREGEKESSREAYACAVKKDLEKI